MDIQVQELIDKIKKDGVAEAEAKAAGITKQAEEKAKNIIAEAEAKAAELTKKAKQENERLEKSSIDAISQAGRNLLITFRDGLVKELDAFIATESAKAYSADTLKTLIPELVKAWGKNPESEDLTVLLSKKDLDTLESSLKAALKDKIAKGLEIKADNELSGGFRIGVKDGSAYYDFSEEAVSNLFAQYLNPRIADILRGASK
ncbi:MAG: V-type ATP synthase subunit E [Treponemataceae bacterium]|nr:MAG: V-type ATP synthase subunit E [Treponemataceae bacterium]